jgi:hypothetical protein
MVMQYPGYLRYFDGVVRGLADNGHELFLAFESPRKQSEGMEAVDPRVKVLDVPLKRGDSWAELARDFRGTLDYVHYLHPDFADAEYLRRRWAAEFLPAAFRWLTRIRSVRPGAVAALVAAGKALERAIPPSPQMDDLIRSVRPDLVVVSPLITTPTQTDLIKAARLHGIPNVVCVASWDHLTTKGVVRAEPDRAIVWNEAQRAEALRYHGLAAEKLIVTGAQPFDRWFERTRRVLRSRRTRAREALRPVHRLDRVDLSAGARAEVRPRVDQRAALLGGRRSPRARRNGPPASVQLRTLVGGGRG